MNRALLINLNNGREYVIGGNTTIGRAKNNDLVLDDTNLAGTHARIQDMGNGWYLSLEHPDAVVEMNGFRVPSQGRLGLRPGCRLKIGDALLQFSTDPAQIEQALARQGRAGTAGAGPSGENGAGSASRQKKKKGNSLVGILLALAAVGGLCLAFFLTDGFKSREVRELEEQIEAIGEVSLDSQSAIDRAREARDRLSSAELDRVKNAGELEEAERRYETLLCQKAAEDFDRAVEEQGPVSLESEAELIALRESYLALDEQSKSFVTREPQLAEAETRLQQLKDQAAAELLDQQFRSIGEVTLDSGDLISQARTAYSKAEPAVKALVRDLAVLEEAETCYRQLLEDRDYEEIMALHAAGERESFVGKCLDFRKSYPDSQYRTELEGLCVTAYLDLSRDQEYDGMNEAALNTLKDCEKHAFQGDEGRTEAALQSLQEKLEAARPKTGYVLDGYCRGGYCQLVVQNGSSDALIKIESTEDPEHTYMAFYVRANETASLDVKDGSYTFKYATGDTWFGLKELFGADTVYNQADTLLNFETTYKGSYVYYSRETITLYSVLGGNMSSTPIGAGEF